MWESGPLQGQIGTLLQDRARTVVPAQSQVLTLSPAGTTRWLLWTTIVLASIHVLDRLAAQAFPNFPGHKWLVTMFGLGGEANLPATFSGGLLLFSALLLAVIALGKRRTHAAFAAHWTLLAAIFFFLGLDELASIHDNLSLPLSRLYRPTGALLYLWVVPYGAATLLLLLGSVRFLAHLPPTTRWRFLLAGAVYVGGALGMELLEAASNARDLHTGFVPLMGVAVEETMEMVGAVLFIHALLRYLEQQMPGAALQLRVASSPQPNARPD